MVLKYAQQLGNKLAGNGSSSGSSTGPSVDTEKEERSAGNAVSQRPTKAQDDGSYLCFEILPYKDNELGYSHWEGFLSNFSSINEPFHFAIEGNVSALRLYMYVPSKYKSYVENTFYATFNSSDLKIIPGKSMVQGSSYVKFSDDCAFYETGEFSKVGSYVDPFKDVLSLFTGIGKESFGTITYSCVFKPKKSLWKKILDVITGKAFRTKKVSKGDEKGSDVAKKEQQEDVKKSGKDVKFSLHYSLQGMSKHQQNEVNEDVLHVFDKFLQIGSLKQSAKKASVSSNIGTFVNMFHIPTKTNTNNSLNYVKYRKLEHPVNLPTEKNTPSEELTLLGTTEYRNEGTKFGIRREDKFRHVYIVGKTGMGKSTFISNMVRSDMHRNNGIAVVDPHGDLVEDVMAHIPSYRTNDVVIFDVSDTSYPVGFNILEYNSPDEKNLVASAVVSIFKKLFAHSRGPRLEYVLRNVILSILEYPNATLMHVVRMLTDKNFREEVLSNVVDPVVMKFWRDEYDKWQDKQKNEAIGPIANKIGQFLSSPVVRNIFAQPKSSLNLRKIMDEGKILLINLSKGKIGEDNASMIGSFLVSKFQIDAMSRADIDFKNRRDFYLYIDEFQNFATDSFESILSEARKYRLSLIVANQYTTQIQENVRNAIFGNVGTIVSFGLGYDDATMMSQQFKEMITPNDLLSLPKFKAYTKLMVDGVTTDPFTMGTFPLPDPELSDEIKDKIRKQSRQRYGMEREKLEELLKVRMSKQFTQSEKVTEKVKKDAIKEDGTAFSTSDLTVGERYDGYVKLIYNYGIFVTVKGVEGLLHKSLIDVPGNLDGWKNIYTIGDKIRVKVDGFKDIDGVKRVVWSQKK